MALNPKPREGEVLRMFRLTLVVFGFSLGCAGLLRLVLKLGLGFLGFRGLGNTQAVPQAFTSMSYTLNLNVTEPSGPSNSKFSYTIIPQHTIIYFIVAMIYYIIP